MPVVEVAGKTKLDQIHYERMEDAMAQLIFELMRLGGPVTYGILAKWGVHIMVGLEGPVVTIGYPPGASKINESVLSVENARLTEEQKTKAKPKKKVKRIAMKIGKVPRK